MAYTKQNWECGDLITADKMNHIEDGIEAASQGGGGDTIFVRYDHMEEVGQNYVYYFDKTWQEVHDALNAGKVVVTQVFSSTVVPLTVTDGGIDVICGATLYGSQYEVVTFGNLINPDGTNLFDPLSAPMAYLTISKSGK